MNMLMLGLETDGISWHCWRSSEVLFVLFYCCFAADLHIYTRFCNSTARFAAYRVVVFCFPVLWFYGVRFAVCCFAVLSVVLWFLRFLVYGVNC